MDISALTSMPLRTSPEIDKLAAALAKAQGGTRHPKKNRTAKITTKSGDRYEYNYADLSDVIDALKEHFFANELSIIQVPYVDRSQANSTCVGVVTRIMHSSGQWLEGELALPVADAKPQSIGSAITYGRRYMLAPMGGIASDEDDDGNLAQGNVSKDVKQKPGPKPKQKDAPAEEPSKPFDVPPPEDVFEIPFGRTPEAVYTELPSQKRILAMEAKKHNITHPVHLASISKGVRGVLVDHLEAAIKEWLAEFGDQLI